MLVTQNQQLISVVNVRCVAGFPSRLGGDVVTYPVTDVTTEPEYQHPAKEALKLMVKVTHPPTSRSINYAGVY